MKRFIVIMSTACLILVGFNLLKGGEGARKDSVETVEAVSEEKNYQGLHNP